jgi:hypothetical protein
VGWTAYPAGERQPAGGPVLGQPGDSAPQGAFLRIYEAEVLIKSYALLIALGIPDQYAGLLRS